MQVAPILCAVLWVGLVASMAEPPRLQDYPVTDIFRGKPSAPVLSTKEARMFRTELRRQAARGPNFAGHYTLALWGCGAGCANGAVIDARSGQVWFILSTLRMCGSLATSCAATVQASRSRPTY